MISIIVPIYGVEKYIRQCIDSIINQSYKNLEIILVDDGSKDKCGMICDEYAQKDARIKVIHKKNGGLVSARKAGLSVATGEYVGFVDGDDWIEPIMYEEIAKRIEKDSPDIVMAEFYCEFKNHKETSTQIFTESFYDKDMLKNKIYPNMLFNGKFYLFGISPNCWSKVFRRELLKRNLQEVDVCIKMGEDAAFTYPCLLEASTVSCIKTPLYHYRIVSTSMSRGYDENLENIILLPYYRLRETNELVKGILSEQLNYYLIYLVNFLIRNEAKAFGRKSKKEIKKTIKNIIFNDDIINSSIKVERNRLPIHTKIIVNLISKKSVFGLYLYIRGLNVYLKKG